MTPHPQQSEQQPPSRRKFVGGAAAAVGAATLTGVGIGASTPAQARTATGRVTTSASGASCTAIPNKYDEPFEVCDDELFVFMANYKPFEYPGFFDTVVGDAMRAAFPGLKIKAVAWDQPVRYEDLDKAGVVPDIILEDPQPAHRP